VTTEDPIQRIVLP